MEVDGFIIATHQLVDQWLRLINAHDAAVAR